MSDQILGKRIKIKAARSACILKVTEMNEIKDSFLELFPKLKKRESYKIWVCERIFCSGDMLLMDRDVSWTFPLHTETKNCDIYCSDNSRDIQSGMSSVSTTHLPSMAILSTQHQSIQGGINIQKAR